MTKTLKKSRFFPSSNKIKIEPELNITKSRVPPKLQSFKQKLLSGNGFVESK